PVSGDAGSNTKLAVGAIAAAVAELPSQGVPAMTASMSTVIHTSACDRTAKENVDRWRGSAAHAPVRRVVKTTDDTFMMNVPRSQFEDAPAIIPNTGGSMATHSNRYRAGRCHLSTEPINRLQNAMI